MAKLNRATHLLFIVRRPLMTLIFVKSTAETQGVACLSRFERGLSACYNTAQVGKAFWAIYSQSVRLDIMQQVVPDFPPVLQQVACYIPSSALHWPLKSQSADLTYEQRCRPPLPGLSQRLQHNT